MAGTPFFPPRTPCFLYGQNLLCWLLIYPKRSVKTTVMPLSRDRLSNRNSLIENRDFQYISVSRIYRYLFCIFEGLGENSLGTRMILENHYFSLLVFICLIHEEPKAHRSTVIKNRTKDSFLSDMFCFYPLARYWVLVIERRWTDRSIDSYIYSLKQLCPMTERLK